MLLSAVKLTRTDDSALSKWFWTIDRSLLAAFLTLIIFGIFMVTAASPAVAERVGLGPYHFLIKHLMFLTPTVACLIGLSFLSARNVWRVSTILLAATILAMGLVLVTGMEIKGAQRWLHLPFFSLQPSEFIKPSFAIVAAWLISYQKTHEDFPANLICAGLFLVIVTLLMLQPDLGMTVVVTSILASQIFLAGLPFRYLVMFGLGAVACLGLAYLTFGHVQSRIDRFLDPSSGDSYQIEKSLEAFRSGGIFGAGPGQGDVKLRLPDAHADFIFSVIGEELGLPFTFLLMGIYLFILLRGFRVLSTCTCLFTVLAAGGLLVMLGLQTFIHMGSALQLLPAKGMTLPFISYGGSSLLSMGISMGMLLALLRRQEKSTIGSSHSSQRRENTV
ncbi:MAG: cell division protein FtsW [Rhodospirillales bacterium]|nr:cell division protein FtsW [Rhodospirillales bacterium]MCB9965494.1 cell division protein FtsW [Rhodospirillales bacterium]MCB9973642.1 cell division protein FtsW [Rhodospirillales bacterium]MCB9980444.1 cell division protein FtsW [Rhodospirillales bacterium]